ncbi:MAG: Na+-transporting NADH:ubiquinone oxidoreductase subunit A, partial [Lysobacterales bacterium]
TVVCASIASLTEGSDLSGMRCISGSVLSGKAINADGFIGSYESQITIIPEGGQRKILGWLVPGLNSYTFSNTFASVIAPKESYSLDADKNGGDRAIVCNHLFDQYTPLDIPVYFLLKAVLSNDIEEAESMGILEVDEEDFALCTFACPSKTEVGSIIRQGLDTIEKEG